MKRIVLIIITLITLGIIISAYTRTGNSSEQSFVLPEPSSNQSEQTQATQVSTQHARPVTLSIPSLQVSAEVEYVGLDEKRHMDVPKHDMNVAWYELGYSPGEKGNAVMAGHLDTITGAPAIFYNLDRLRKGDTIIVHLSDDTEITFSVTHVAVYENENFPLAEVFGPHDKARLNLITCRGHYDSQAKNYSQRTVVYSELL